MKLEEVLPALREGRRIRAKGWRPECYIIRNKDEFIDERGYEFGFMTMGHLDADWEIVPEPKKLQSWIKLYSNGEVFGFNSPEDCERSITLAEDMGQAKLVETRLVEWEVPDNG